MPRISSGIFLPPKKITTSATITKCCHGPIESNWKKGENGLSWKVVIPANTTASIRIPAASADKVTESGKPLLQNPAVKSVNAADGFVVVEAGSGTFDFLAGK